MEKKEFENKIKNLAQELEIALDENQIEKFFIYMELLLEWNEKINLTAITNPDDIILKHFIDSITISKHIKNGAKLIDVGTGAGFPGIPLKIIRDDLEIVLIDSLNKRILFLEEVIKKLKLNNIKVFHARAEEFGKNKLYREQFDYATSRAVANLATLSEYLLPFVKKSGKVICMKSSNIDEELMQANKAIAILGGKLQKKESFVLPKSDIARTILIVEKESQTPLKYPRKAGIPAKEPLK